MRALKGKVMNIVDSWLTLFDRPTDALNTINEDLGSKFNTGNLTQWKKEQKGLTPKTYNYMLEKVLKSDINAEFDTLRMPDPKSISK